MARDLFWFYFPIKVAGGHSLSTPGKIPGQRLLMTTLVLAKAPFIRKILCFEVFKILFSQLVDRMLKKKSLLECKAPPPQPPPPPSSAYFFALPVKNDPLPPELKFSENIGTSQDDPLHIGPKIYRFLYFISYS